MEFLFNLFKQLVTTLSPAEFVVVIAVIIGTSFYVVKLVLKLGGKKGILAGLLGQEDPVEALTKKLDTVIARQQEILSAIDDVKVSVNAGRADHKVHDQTFSQHLSQLAMVQRDMQDLKQELHDANADMRQLIQMTSNQAQSGREQIILTVQRGQDIMVRLENNVAKMEEFIRASTPEFRTNFKELGKEISDLGKDIALVERSLQNQINTSNAVNLR
jgi:uncharacterized coiled-coil DUF342 family protein